jgi:hypothetical protein
MPDLLNFQVSFSSEEKGKNKKKKTNLTIDTEDIIAIFAGIVAVMVVVAMIAKWMPINEYTVGLAGFSGVGAVIANVKGRRRKSLTADKAGQKEQDDKEE